MINFKGNAETVHFANWCLYSDEVAIGRLLERAASTAKEKAVAEIAEERRAATAKERVAQMSEEDEGHLMEEILLDELGGELSNVLDEKLRDVFDCGGVGLLDLPGFSDIGMGGDVESLLVPYVASALYNIDFIIAAELILGERRKVAATPSVAVSA